MDLETTGRCRDLRNDGRDDIYGARSWALGVGVYDGVVDVPECTCLVWRSFNTEQVGASTSLCYLAG